MKLSSLNAELEHAGVTISRYRSVKLYADAKYVVRVSVSGRAETVGHFPTLETAALAARQTASERVGSKL